MREEEKQGRGARGAGVEVKAVVAVAARVCLLLFCILGEEEENLAGCLAVALHTNIGVENTRPVCLTLPSSYLRESGKNCRRQPVRYGPLLASSGRPSILRNSQGNAQRRDKWNASTAGNH